MIFGRAGPVKVFVFRAERADRIKLLVRDQTGMVLVHMRYEPPRQLSRQRRRRKLLQPAQAQTDPAQNLPDTGRCKAGRVRFH
ncbi:hypothetical protein D3P04_13165 [Paracoccus onubensis]|uniref:Uncharacterized protein n=1 Tax=Paracoccus onubensis TaxID=1675788 RepID=A0A418SUF1_9RHOB|nr:hypothetical protein D3P04_13165 [Paracoccus onubensis]